MKKTGLTMCGCDIWIDTDYDVVVDCFKSNMETLQKEAYGEESSRLKAVGRVQELRRKEWVG